MATRTMLGAYIFSVYAALACALAAAGAIDSSFERAWLAPVVAVLIALGHLGETHVLRGREQRESFSHDETYVVLLALLASPVVGSVAFAAGLLVGSAIARRDVIKAVFNVGSMTLSVTLALVASAALAGGDDSSPRAAAAALAAAVVFYVTNRLLLSGVLAIVGAQTFRGELTDDAVPRLVVAGADTAIGLLAALAALERMWTLPLGLAALSAVHYALSGHAAARAERQKLAEIVDSSSDGIILAGRNGRVLAWNPASEALTGYAAAEMVGRSLEEVARMLDADEETVVRTRDSRESTAAVRTKSGARRWLGVSRAPTPERGEVLLLRDETRRREFEELRAREERERLRADLVAAVSHELRTPLASILGFTQTLLKREASEADRRRFLEIILQQGERLRDLIDDLLDLRSVAARGTGDSDLFDLRELLSEQVSEFTAQAPTHRLALDLPAEALTIRGDRSRVRQVVANLLSNAIK